MSHKSYRKRKKSIKNSFLHEMYQYSGFSEEPTSVKLIQFNNRYFLTKDLPLQDKLKSHFRDDCYNWYHISGFSNPQKIASIFMEFDINPIDAKSIHEVDSLAQVNEYPQKTYVTVNSLYFDAKNELQREHVSFVLGKNYLLTFQETGAPLFTDVIEALKHSTAQLREKGCDYLMILLLSNILSFYTEGVYKIEEDFDAITDTLIDREENDSLLAEVQMHRKNFVRLKRAVFLYKELITKVIRDTNGLINCDYIIFLNDLLNQTQYVIQKIDGCNESLNEILNLYYNNNNQKMSEIMKRLTVISSIFIPLTFCAGVWGMNFKIMPETELKYGYPLALLMMVIVAFFNWYYLKKKKWF